MLDRAYLAEGVPTLVVWGRRDAIIPLGHGRLAHAALPGSELEIFDEAGHFPHHTDPERFVQVVHQFVQRTSPARFDRDEWRLRLRQGRRSEYQDPGVAAAATGNLTLLEEDLSAEPSA
jgi:fermentation-respiration switch protein FrsA (DUF1100 family)